MKYRILECTDSNGVIWNYDIQARFLFIWLTIGNSRTLNHAKKIISQFNGSVKEVK